MRDRTQIATSTFIRTLASVTAMLLAQAAYAQSQPEIDGLRPGAPDAQAPALTDSAESVLVNCLSSALPTDGSTTGNIRAPHPRFRGGRGVYLITASELAATGLPIGATVSAIGWHYATAPGFVASGTLQVYLENTADTTNLKGTSFATATSTMTLVHDAATTLPNSNTPFDIPLSLGGIFSYGGGGIYVAFDWRYPVGPLSSAALVACNTALTGGIASSQTIGVPPAADLLAASNLRPETRLTTPAANNDASVQHVIALGALPRDLVGPQVFQAVVTNRSVVALTDLPVTLAITGANTFSDTQTVPILAACGGQAVVIFAAAPVGVLGTDAVSASVPPDESNANNSKTRPLDITLDRYSYKHPGTIPSGGVGFNAATGALVAKFTTTTVTSVTAATLEFFAASATTYRVAIYADSGGGTPGAQIYLDAADRTVAGAGPVTISLPSAVSVGPGNFYIGIHQTNTINANYSFDAESPIRVGTFYVASLPATSWTDVAPGNNFKLNIGVILDLCAGGGEGNACTDGSACTTNDTCSGGACVSGAAPNCDDASACTTDTCDSVTGCVHTNIGGSCNDNNVCTTADSCSGGVCIGTPTGPPSEVDDGVRLAQSGGITLITWNQASGSAPSDVVRGQLGALPVGPGGGDEICLGDNLGAGFTTHGEDPATGSGFWYLVRGSGPCGDGPYGVQGFHGVSSTPRATTTCSGFCDNQADGTPCDDGNSCTQTDGCQSEVCTGANPVVCAAIDSCHIAGTCSTETGVCSNPSKPEGATCDDGNALSPTDICSSGSCGGCLLGGPVSPRFVDNGNGTVTDRQTCLVWEKKTGTVGTGVDCIPPTTCPEPLDVNNRYQWSTATAAPYDPNGGAFVDFLFKLNAAGFAGRTDWRLPSEEGQNSPFTGPKELQSILLAPCSTSPCIDPIFGPTASYYWSSSGHSDNPLFAWNVGFEAGNPNLTQKNDVNYVRAVRGGPYLCAGVICSAQDQCHDGGTCNPETGVCSNPAKLDGSACSDGSTCTANDACSGGACVAGPKPTPVSFCNNNAISIPDSGIATPYPSSVTVSGLPGVICKVTVNLNGITHAVMPDIDAMLSRPTPPTSLIVMSDVGPGAPGVSALSVTLDDAAAASIPVGPVSPSAYQPTNDGAGDPFAGPAPTPSSAVALSTFDGSNPNGTWNLWLVDDAASNSGSMSGWCVNIAAACVTDADCVDSDSCTDDSCNLANGQCVHTINGDVTDTDGDRLTNCVETNTGVYVGPLSTGTNPNNPDTDGDTIRDGDEVLGTLAGLNLPAMGASPLKKNILLEYDWFNDNNDPTTCFAHSHRPTQAMIDRTSAAFASAPVLNPDGTTGITLIHDYGQGGAFTGGNFVADADGVIAGGVNNADFQAIKNANFATNRRAYFHYTLLPHRYNTTSDSSGQAELPGNDLIVSLYCFSGTNNTSNTIMHELGHNLLLRHGGNTNCNWMPNYNSVMNYRYQFSGIDSNASCNAIGNSGETNVPSYSIGARLSLNENALNEFAGVCGAPPIDWNGNFAIENPVVYDLNRQGTSPTSPLDPDELASCGAEFSTLNDFNDWANFVFTGLSDADFAPPTKTEVIDCENPSLPRIVSP